MSERRIPGPPNPPPEPVCRCGRQGVISLWSIQGHRYRRFCAEHVEEIARAERQRIREHKRRYWRSFKPGAAVEPWLYHPTEENE